jgi:putative Holliday junction resolvase
MILGVDPGERRVGVAIADPETLFARPVEVIDGRSCEPVDRIAALVEDAGVTLVVVGRPVGLSGRSGPAIRRQEVFVGRLRARLSVEVVEYDERLTTVVAERALRSAGAPARVRRRARDAIAAQVMLQSYLEQTRGP